MRSFIHRLTGSRPLALGSLGLNALLCCFLVGLAWINREALAQKFFRAIGGTDVVLVGDSLTEGGRWFSLGIPATTLARGGYTCRQIANLAGYSPAPRRPAKVAYVLCGTNDAELDPDRYLTRALAGIASIDSLFSARGTKVVLQSVPARRGPSPLNPRIDSLNQAIRQYAASHHLEYLDLADILEDDSGLKPDLTTDGTHLTLEAYSLWSGKLRADLERFR